MNKQIFRIETPCHAGPENMTKNTKGWHCSLCAMQVHDFDKMSLEEINALFNSKTRVCASITTPKPNDRSNGFFRYLIRRVVLLAGLSAIFSSCYQKTKGKALKGELQADSDTIKTEMENISKQDDSGALKN